MSAKGKIRGYQNEKWTEQKHKEAGIPCERVPLSGSIGGKYAGDLAIPDVNRRMFILECKARRGGAGFKVLEGWMKDKDILIVKRNYQDPLVVMSFDLYLRFMKVYMEMKGEIL